MQTAPPSRLGVISDTEELRIKNGLRSYRFAAHLDQSEAADLLGIARPRLSMYETGRILPTWPLAQRMTRLYHCTLEDLYPDPDLSRRIAESNPAAGQ